MTAVVHCSTANCGRDALQFLQSRRHPATGAPGRLAAPIRIRDRQAVRGLGRFAFGQELFCAIQNCAIGDARALMLAQPEPTSCIHVPTFETIVAIHRLRKSPFCRGLHAEGGTRTGASPALPVMRGRSRFHRFPQRRVDRVEQQTQTERNILDAAADEKCRRVACAALSTRLHVFSNALQIPMIIHLGSVP